MPKPVTTENAKFKSKFRKKRKKVKLKNYQPEEVLLKQF